MASLNSQRNGSPSNSEQIRGLSQGQEQHFPRTSSCRTAYDRSNGALSSLEATASGVPPARFCPPGTCADSSSARRSTFPDAVSGSACKGKGMTSQS